MIIVHSWQGVRSSFKARPSEWCMTGMIICMGIICFLNPTLMQSGTYSFFVAIADQEIWGTIFVGLGVARLFVLYINGAYWRSPELRSAFAFLSVLLFINMTIGVTANFGLGLAIYPWLAILDVSNAWRSAGEAGISHLMQARKREANRRDAN